jgi:Cu-processing system permease protein
MNTLNSVCSRLDSSSERRFVTGLTATAAEHVNPVTNRRSAVRPSAIRHIAAVATKEFGDRFRSGWVIACMLLWLGAVGLASFFGLLQIGRIGLQGYERTVVSLLNLVQYLVPLLGLLLGHDLMVSESEERTLRLIFATGASRSRVLLGKFIGGCLTLSVPLALGFGIAGVAIGLSAGTQSLLPFTRLALSGLGLGVLFLAIGLTLSTFSRTRVQALVLALLAWCVVVFVFDLVALGCLVSTKAATASHEIEIVCDATHINSAADLHSAYDALADGRTPVASATASPSLGWLALNPVDVFRALNLPAQFDIRVSALGIALCVIGWLAFTLGASLWKLRRTDF